MLQKFKRKCKPTVLLLIVGFAVSFTSALVGIGAIGSLIEELAKADNEIPIYLTMQNTALSLALAIYVFSVANCLVIANCRILTRQRDIAIRKAFGWSNKRVIGMIFCETAVNLGVSFILGLGLIAAVNSVTSGMLSIKITLFFVLGTCVLLLITLCVAVCVPIAKILKIRPAQVVS